MFAAGTAECDLIFVLFNANGGDKPCSVLGNHVDSLREGIPAVDAPLRTPTSNLLNACEQHSSGRHCMCATSNYCSDDVRCIARMGTVVARHFVSWYVRDFVVNGLCERF